MFELHNAALWPLHVLTLAAGLAMVLVMLRPTRSPARWMALALAIVWAGDRSHLEDFDRIEANSMLELEPPAHTRLRTLVNRAFVSRQVERLRAARRNSRQPADRHISEGRREADLLPAFASPLPITIIAEMLGVPVEMGPKLLEWSHDMVAMYMHGRTRETAERADRAARAFSDFIRELRSAKGARSPPTICFSMLLSAQEDGQKLSEDELVSSAILLLNAGHEATVHQTGNAVRALLAQGGDPRRFFVTR